MTSAKGRRRHGAKCLCCGKRHGDGAPWWYEGKSGWFLTAGKSRRLLAKGSSVKDRDAHDKAMTLWQAGNAGTRPSAEPEAADVPGDGEDMTVEQLCDIYLDYLKRNAAQKTFVQCQALYKDLCDHPKYGIGSLTVRQLRKGGVARVKRWAKAHNGWNGSLATVYQRVKAVFNFAANSDDSEEAMDLIQSSPIKKLNTGKNRARHRTRVTVFSQEQIDAILAYCEKSSRCPTFGLAFKALVSTGCRPEEFCSVTAADVKRDEKGNLYWFVEHKNQKHTGERRRVYMLSKEMVEITQRQAGLYPDGALFRNGWGKPWTKGSLLNQLRAICRTKACKALGLDETDAVTRNGRKQYKYVTYSTRHTFGYRWVNGFYGKELSYQRVADLMGNSALEVERTYGHAEKGTPAFVGRLLAD